MSIIQRLIKGTMNREKDEAINIDEIEIIDEVKDRKKNRRL